MRKAEHLAGISGLIIPGGESTTMANVAERWGLVRGHAARLRPAVPTSLLPLATPGLLRRRLHRIRAHCPRTRRSRRSGTSQRAGGRSGARVLGSSSLLTPPKVRSCGDPAPNAPARRRRSARRVARARSAGQKEGGQALIGGLDVLVSRNFFGSQARASPHASPPPPPHAPRRCFTRGPTPAA